MDFTQLETEINTAWDNRNSVTLASKGTVRDAVFEALHLLERVDSWSWSWS